MNWSIFASMDFPHNFSQKVFLKDLLNCIIQYRHHTDKRDSICQIYFVHIHESSNKPKTLSLCPHMLCNLAKNSNKKPMSFSFTYFVFWFHYYITCKVVIIWYRIVCIVVHCRVYFHPLKFWFKELWNVQYNGQKYYWKNVPEIESYYIRIETMRYSVSIG